MFKKGFSSNSELSDFNEEAFEYIVSLEKEKRRLQKKNVSSSTSFNIEDFLNESFIEDDTATNGSSISFIIEYKNTKLLFLADSHPSVIIESLKKHYKQEEFTLSYGSSEGVTKENCDTVSIYVDRLCTNEQSK